MPIEINQRTIMKAKADAKVGRVDIGDRFGRGLVLRGGPAGLLWQHRKESQGKTLRLVIGTVDRWTVEEARAIANAASDHIKTFGTPADEAWLTQHLIDTGKIAAPPPEPEDDGSGNFPTFAEGRQEYLDYAAGYLSVVAVSLNNKSLCHRKLKALDDRRLPTITRDDVMEIVLDVHQEHERSAELIVAAIRPLFNFFGEDGRRRRFGVEPGLMVGLKSPRRKMTVTEDEDDDDDPWSAGYVPEISELGLIIAVARSGLMTPTTGAAVELTCWTVQRRRAISTARLQDFFDLGDGTGLWRIPAKSRKGKKKRPHTIPLPAPVWDCVKRAAAAALKRNPETKYLFPGARPRRIGMAVTHMSPYTLGHRFTDIPGSGATPHDVRRCMGTHGEKLIGFSRIDTGFIMDHEESVKQSERITSRTKGTDTHDVTGVHYSLHDGTHHSWPVMRAWAEAVEKAVVEATAALDLKQLATEYGDPNYRIGARPWGMVALTDPDEIVEAKKRERVVKSRVLALGLADDDA